MTVALLVAIIGGCADAHGGRRSRGRRAERQRADAVRREGQCLSQAALAARCAASRSRRCIRTTSAPSWSTARPSTCTIARTWRSAVHHRDSRAASRSSRHRDWQLVGLTIPNFWRKTIVPVRVGDRVETGAPAAAAVDPRARPRRGSAGALSAGRLLARAPAAAGEPEMERLRLVVPGRADRDASSGRSSTSARSCSIRTTQDVPAEVRARRQRDLAAESARHRPAGARRDARSAGRRSVPFAALRSMFVTEINNDVAHLGWRGEGRAPSWERSADHGLRQRASAVEVWAGRLVPSRHNTSAPDMVFRDFRAK